MTRRSCLFRNLLICTLFVVSFPTKADPIHDAALDGNAELVEHLLSEGADVDAPDPAGTPLQWALFANQKEIVHLLLERGADPNVGGGAPAPLLTATVNGDAETVRLLLEHGGNPNKGDTSTPLIAAVQKGNLEIAELLLGYQADPNFSTLDGTTALHEAASRGYLEIVQALLERGADVNALTETGKPPIHFALLGNHLDVASYLTKQGLAPVEIAPITDLLASADVVQGKTEAEFICAQCHHLESDKSSYGPSLWNVVGRPKAGMKNFTYSQAFTTLEGTWTYNDLNNFLAQPFMIIPGTQMRYPGEPDPQKRANLIAYLRTLSDDPIPLP